MPHGVREQGPIQSVDDRTALSTALLVQADIACLFVGSRREVALCPWRIARHEACMA